MTRNCLYGAFRSQGIFAGSSARAPILPGVLATSAKHFVAAVLVGAGDEVGRAGHMGPF